MDFREAEEDGGWDAAECDISASAPAGSQCTWKPPGKPPARGAAGKLADGGVSMGASIIGSSAALLGKLPEI